jgi:hypothetical protein
MREIFSVNTSHPMPLYAQLERRSAFPRQLSNQPNRPSSVVLFAHAADEETCSEHHR